MVALAEGTGRVLHPRELLQSVEERESLCSTALPGGLALLHSRHHTEYSFDGSFVVLTTSGGDRPPTNDTVTRFPSNTDGTEGAAGVTTRGDTRVAGTVLSRRWRMCSTVMSRANAS